MCEVRVQLLQWRPTSCGSVAVCVLCVAVYPPLLVHKRGSCGTAGSWGEHTWYAYASVCTVYHSDCSHSPPTPSPSPLSIPSSPSPSLLTHPHFSLSSLLLTLPHTHSSPSPSLLTLSHPHSPSPSLLTLHSPMFPMHLLPYSIPHPTLPLTFPPSPPPYSCANHSWASSQVWSCWGCITSRRTLSGSAGRPPTTLSTGQMLKCSSGSMTLTCG